MGAVGLSAHHLALQMRISPLIARPARASRLQRSAPRESGQAAIEAALTMPLMIFILLGTIQLFMMLHARILTQLAAFQVTRAGSMNHGNCARMLHAGILQVLPAIEPFVKPTGTLATNVATAFNKYKANTYNGRNVNVGSGKSVTFNSELLWIVRDIAGRPIDPQEAEVFDQSVGPMRLETQVIFWFPLRVPFANWIFARMMLAHYGMQAYANQNPLLISQKANWTQTTPNQLSAEVKAHLAATLGAGEYVFPIVASYTMRMMTPLKPVNMVVKNCAPTPNTL